MLFIFVGFFCYCFPGSKNTIVHVKRSQRPFSSIELLDHYSQFVHLSFLPGPTRLRFDGPTYVFISPYSLFMHFSYQWPLSRLLFSLFRSSSSPFLSLYITLRFLYFATVTLLLPNTDKRYGLSLNRLQFPSYVVFLPRRWNESDYCITVFTRLSSVYPLDCKAPLTLMVKAISQSPVVVLQTWRIDRSLTFILSNKPKTIIYQI